MMLCKNCKHENMDGAVFCAECGSQLAGKEALVTQNISTNDLRKKHDRLDEQGEDKYQQFNGGDAWGSLHLLDTGHVIPLAAKSQFTLGRVSEGQPIMPDIDLSAHQAYAAGVSRLHAIIKRGDAHIIFMDLGSANGSFVNGKRLPPNEEQTIKHGDVVALGKMKIQVLLKTPS
jgi:hypothetical protein